MEKSMEKQCKNNNLKIFIPIMLIIMSFVISCRVAAQKNISTSDNQCVSEEDNLLKERVYTVVDKSPTYPKGEIGLLKFISSNFKLSDMEVDAELSFKVQLVIDEEGGVIGQRIKNKNLQELTAAEKEILRVIGTTPKWTPGSCKDKIVKVKMDLPIQF